MTGLTRRQFLRLTAADIAYVTAAADTGLGTMEREGAKIEEMIG